MIFIFFSILSHLKSIIKKKKSKNICALAIEKVITKIPPKLARNTFIVIYQYNKHKDADIHSSKRVQLSLDKSISKVKNSKKR